MNFDLFNNLQSLIFWIIGLLLALDIHEFSHSLMADKLGDPTPRANDRLTLNPLAHLDPVGSVLLPLLLFISGFPVIFGWGKPVPIDPFNLKNPRRDSALISLAGPGSNLITALLISLILKLPFMVSFPLVAGFLINLLIISVALAVFNLIPVPPLDGSKIFGFWDESFSQYGLIFLIFLLFPFFGNHSLFGLVIMPIINLMINFLLS